MHELLRPQCMNCQQRMWWFESTEVVNRYDEFAAIHKNKHVCTQHIKEDHYNNYNKY